MCRCRTRTTSFSPERIGKLDGVVGNGKTTISKPGNRFSRELNLVLLMRSAGNVREQLLGHHRASSQSRRVSGGRPRTGKDQIRASCLGLFAANSSNDGGSG